jgi:hypothetical protein
MNHGKPWFAAATTYPKKSLGSVIGGSPIEREEKVCHGL